MNNLQHSVESPKEFLHILAVRWRLWFVPALVVSLGTAIYALTYCDTWEASQALIVRNEAANNERGPGKFAQPEEMKAIQETLLEIAHSRGVLEAALKQVGPHGRLQRIRNLAHRSRHRGLPQDRKTPSAQGRRIRQDRSFLSYGSRS